MKMSDFTLGKNDSDAESQAKIAAMAGRTVDGRRFGLFGSPIDDPKPTQSQIEEQAPTAQDWAYAYVVCGRKSWHLSDAFKDWEEHASERFDYTECYVFRKRLSELDPKNLQLWRDYAEPEAEWKCPSSFEFPTPAKPTQSAPKPVSSSAEICPSCMHDLHDPAYCHECQWEAEVPGEKASQPLFAELALVPALIEASRLGLPADIQELLVHGDASRGIPSGILLKMFRAANAQSQIEEPAFAGDEVEPEDK
jgi:hypothetical protein